jgi:hypothetical protein
MGAVIQRGSHGHFLPGQSENAGGRPASLAHVRDLLRPHAERFVAELVELLDSDEEAIRLAAIKEFMDRYVGKPVATVESDVRTLDVTQAIREMYLQAVSAKPAPPTIEAEPATEVRAPAEPDVETRSSPSQLRDDCEW